MIRFQTFLKKEIAHAVFLNLGTLRHVVFTSQNSPGNWGSRPEEFWDLKYICLKGVEDEKHRASGPSFRNIHQVR